MPETEEGGLIPIGDFPDLGIDPNLVRGHLHMGLPEDISKFDQLSEEERNRIKQESYIPSFDALVGSSDFDMIKDMTYFGRTVVDGPAVNDLHREFGDEETLRKNFLKYVGFVDDEQGEKIMQIFAEVTGHKMVSWRDYKNLFSIKEVLSNPTGTAYSTTNRPISELRVLDDLGPDNTIRAYTWPFIGVGGKTPFERPPVGVQEQLKERFKQAGIKPWRVGNLQLSPYSATKDEKVCVFLGK